MKGQLRGVLLLALASMGACDRAPETTLVDDIAAAPAEYRDRTVRVRGAVTPGSLRTTHAGPPRTSFLIAGARAALVAEHEGAVPDTLYEGNEGTFDGTLVESPSGVFLRVRHMTLRIGRRPPH
ncbi:cytochrome c maturation protein CcmE domain-containing protein [Sorangium sp. So ce406]|uniref:cytochrome c maturation protein CcmE domain-containing protein n=1 Tax=Sorangium sp. So ce406 TaxID=3133311 RepID=UPI003F5C8DB5